MEIVQPSEPCQLYAEHQSHSESASRCPAAFKEDWRKEKADWVAGSFELGAVEGAGSSNLVLLEKPLAAFSNELLE